MTFKDYFKKWVDIIATQQDKIGNLYIFSMSDGKEYLAKKIKEFKGGKSGDSVIMIEIEDRNYVLKVFTEGDREKMIMNAKEIEIHNDVLEIFKKDYQEQHYIPCPLIYSYGYMKEVEFENESKNDGYLRYVIMELISPTYELYDFIKQECTKTQVLYKLNLKSIILEIFYFIGNLIMNGISHCDLHMKNILIIPHENYTLSFGEITNKDIKVEAKEYSIKVIDFGLSEDKDVPCSKIRRTSASLSEMSKVCGGPSNLWLIVLGELKLLRGSMTDINFLYKIIGIFSMVDKSLSYIDIEQIKKYASFMYHVRDKNQKRKILTNILELIL